MKGDQCSLSGEKVTVLKYILFEEKEILVKLQNIKVIMHYKAFCGVKRTRQCVPLIMPLKILLPPNLKLLYMPVSGAVCFEC